MAEDGGRCPSWSWPRRRFGLWHAPPAWAAPGDLDPSFSGDGQAYVDVAAGPDYGMAMARQPDGRILLAGRTGLSDHGNFGVARLKVNGHLDATLARRGRPSTRA